MAVDVGTLDLGPADLEPVVSGYSDCAVVTSAGSDDWLLSAPDLVETDPVVGYAAAAAVLDLQNESEPDFRSVDLVVSDLDLDGAQCFDPELDHEHSADQNQCFALYLGPDFDSEPG